MDKWLSSFPRVHKIQSSQQINYEVKNVIKIISSLAFNYYLHKLNVIVYHLLLVSNAYCLTLIFSIIFDIEWDNDILQVIIYSYTLKPQIFNKNLFYYFNEHISSQFNTTISIPDWTIDPYIYYLSKSPKTLMIWAKFSKIFDQ